MALDLYAGISVGDYERALDWYERLLGAPPDVLAGPAEAVWDLAEHRSVFIVHRPEHAGHSRHTIFVGDADELESWVARIAERGLEPVEREDYPDGMREALFRDPEGNEIWFGGAPAA